MKKQFLRVKQIADQTFLRAEKTEVLTDDLVIAEKRVECIKSSCQGTQKKISSSQIDFGIDLSAEKRLKKIPQIMLGATMLENGYTFTKNSVLGDVLKESGGVQTRLGTEILDYSVEVEKGVLKPIAAVLDNEIHNISKLRKQLGKLVLDMDSARTRFQTAERHSLQTSSNNNFNTVGKVDSLKEEMEEASQKVEQCRDLLATEMFSLISKEPQLSEVLVHFHQLQMTYHKRALAVLESSLPTLEKFICDFHQKPMYGCALEEHLRVTNREIAAVIETCVTFLMEYGLQEEGLLRIAGSASKLKKLKSAFDAGIELDTMDLIRDPHAVSGALKSYLRELPEPLLTYSLYSEWMNAAKISDSENRLQAIWQVLHSLPNSNYNNVKYVIKFLSKVLENVDVNKMTSQNIAIVMAPNLIWSPTEENTSIGMNMTAQSLHTLIVDLLLSYSDWFFPDGGEESIFTRKSDHSDLNENHEVVDNESEVNGNNLQTSSGLTADSELSSPRTPHKGAMRKPAAPPPPTQKTHESHEGDKTQVTSLYPSLDLIDLKPSEGPSENASEGGDVQLGKREEDSLSSSNNQAPPKSPRLNNLSKVPQSPSLKETPKSNIDPTAEVKEPQTSKPTITKASTEGLISFKPESGDTKTSKPTVPSKPGSYSTTSLDRRNVRPSIRNSDPMTRSSHIERPSVPPPERPLPKTSESVEDLCAEEKLLKEQEEKSMVDKPLRHSKSFTKVNRFDFLVNQKEETPPERPPRSNPVPPIDEKMSPDLDSPNSEVHTPSTPKEGEKVKPPRPLPPAKPKMHVLENTNL